MKKQKFWNVVFLLDHKIPTKIVLLKRAAGKKFAPNFYTGVGGKVEEGESILESAKRELLEETGILDVSLREFARCIINNDLIIFYFWGILKNTSLPSSTAGKLEWVSNKKLVKKDLIPSTKELILEWQKRDFKIDKNFTIFVDELGLDRGVRLVSLQKVVEGLVSDL